LSDKKYKILVIAPVWVGDLVMSQTLFMQLQNKYNHNNDNLKDEDKATLQLDVFASQATAALVMRMPQVHQVIINPFKHGTLSLFKRIKLGLKLRSVKYDEVIILPSTLKSAVTPFFAGIKTRTGFIGESRYWLVNNIYKLDKKQLPRMIDRYCALANDGIKPVYIDYPKLSVDVINQAGLLQKFALDTTKPIIAFCPAAEYGPAKRWPPEHFATLADLLVNMDYQILLFGGAKDAELGQQIIGLSLNSANIINLCGKTSLTDAADLLALTKCVVTNDSGLMHVACAVGAKVVAIYGSSSPHYTPPLSDAVKILQIKLDCSPCFKRTCRFGHYNCLRFIAPFEVLVAIKDLMPEWWHI
jgi:heptosyltransferase-2